MAVILTRRQGEQIVIGDEAIVISVEALTKGQVRLKVDAPGYSVHRREVFESIKRDQRLNGRRIYGPEESQVDTEGRNAGQADESVQPALGHPSSGQVRTQNPSSAQADGGVS